MPRIEQINDLLRGELANIIAQEIVIDEGLVTICYVNCSKDLKNAKIAISILPHNISGTVIKKLRKNSSLFSKLLKQRLNLRHIPRFSWIIDDTEKKAAEIEKILQQIKKGK